MTTDTSDKLLVLVPSRFQFRGGIPNLQSSIFNLQPTVKAKILSKLTHSLSPSTPHSDKIVICTHSSFHPY